MQMTSSRFGTGNEKDESDSVFSRNQRVKEIIEGIYLSDIRRTLDQLVKMSLVKMNYVNIKKDKEDYSINYAKIHDLSST